MSENTLFNDAPKVFSSILHIEDSEQHGTQWKLSSEFSTERLGMNERNRKIYKKITINLIKAVLHRILEF